MKKLLISTILVIIFAYIASGTYLYFNQRGYLYFPTPAVTNIDEQEISILSDGIELHGWVINPNKPNAIIYFGGNNEQISENITDFKNIFPDYTVYLINYRGYSGNLGEPSETGFFKDALKIYDTVAPKHNTISVIGRSIGTGTATYLASQRKINKLVLTTPFDSITNIAKDKYPIFPIDFILKDKFNSKQKASLITAKTLVFTAQTDNMVPHKYTNNLLKSLPKKLTTVVNIKNSNHTTIINKQDYLNYLKDWFSIN